MLIQAHMQQVRTAVPTAMKKSTIHIEVLPSGLSDDALAYSILFLDTLTTGMLTLLTVATGTVVFLNLLMCITLFTKVSEERTLARFTAASECDGVVTALNSIDVSLRALTLEDTEVYAANSRVVML